MKHYSWVITMFMRITFVLFLSGFILIYEGGPLFFQKRWKELIILGVLLMFSLYIFFGYSGLIPYVDLKTILEYVTTPIRNLFGLFFD